MLEDENLGDISVANHYHYGTMPNGDAKTPPTTTPAPIAPIAAVEPKQKLTKTDLQNYIKRKIAEGIATAQKSQAVPQTPLAAAEPKPWYKRWTIPLVAAASLGTGGIGAATYNYLTKPAAVATPDQTEYGFKITSQPGHGISTE